jgi:hypothetical protein
VSDQHPTPILASRGRRPVIDQPQELNRNIHEQVHHTTQFRLGKQMDWAGQQALKDIYGRGHFGTVASHAQRWRQFCNWARSNHGINDACAIDQSSCWKTMPPTWQNGSRTKPWLSAMRRT